MPEAGLFAGEVTQSAPADEAPTEKQKGYHWFEYGLEPGGLCGYEALLDQGKLLGPTLTTYSGGVGQLQPFEAGVSYNDSKVISLTAAFIRGLLPVQNAYVMAVYSTPINATTFDVYMDTSGFMQIRAKNNSNTTILSVTIKNNGSSFADSTVHEMGVVINLADPASREIYINDVNRTDDAAYVTWNIYTDDIIDLADDGTGAKDKKYYFGVSGNGTISWNWNASGFDEGIENLGFVSFDDSCSLICSAMWDDAGNLRDPQKWEGWYLTQPQVFFGPSFSRNTGKTEPATYGANTMEKGMHHSNDRWDFAQALIGGVSEYALLLPKTSVNDNLTDSIEIA